MIKKMLIDSKQPLSLKWKWGILLLISFFVIGLTGIQFYHQKTLSSQFAYLNDFAQRRFDTLQMVLEDRDTPYQRKDLNDPVEEEDQDLLRYFRMIENESMSIRVFNNANQLIYETATISIPTGSFSSDLKTVETEDGPAIVGYNRIISTENGEKLGQIQLVLSVSAIQALQGPQKNHYLIALAAILLLALILAVVISIRFLRPLTYLNNSLDLVEEENLSELRVKKPRSNDEWSDLSVHVNRLLDKIDLYVRNQRQFVEDVSHELRTPVAIVEGHLKMLNRWGKDDPEILEESIAASLQEISRMKGLVQEMLDLSRADHVDLDYKDEITEIYSTTRQVFNNFVILYPDFQFYLDSEKGDSELYVKIFRNHFEQILIVLLDNAVKYSRDRPEVHISVNKSLSKVEIAIQDFGEGMTEEDKERVFGRFYRVDKARSRNKGGNGLGLSIAKQLVEGYKGEIHVESVLGHGSIFYVDFPVLSDTRQIYKSKQIAEKKNL